MNQRLKIFMTLLGIWVATGMDGIAWGQDKSPQRIEARVLNRMIENRETLMIINIASYLECMDTRIPASICMSCDQGKDLQDLFPANKETKLVFYAGSVPIEPGCPVIEETIRRGFTKTYFLRGGLSAWRRAGYDTESVNRIPRRVGLSIKPKDLGTWLKQIKSPLILDIRSSQRFKDYHIEGALNIPMSVLHQQYQDIPLNRSLLVVDEEGSRSFLAASYLSRKGFTDSRRLVGGMEAWNSYIRRGTPK
jgi:rhodanese-related sulfurtransferase